MILQAVLALWASIAPVMGDHLWQSSLFCALIGILAFALRKNQARIRYWVWLTASVKFLIPFSLLIALGSHLTRARLSTPTQAVVYSAVEDFSQPFGRPNLPVIYHLSPVAAPVNSLHLLPAMLVVVWLVGVIVILFRWFMGWTRILLVVRNAVSLGEGPEADALRRLESNWGVRTPIILVRSRDWMEPGIFGIFRPVLIWPEGISGHLDARNIELILAHEICHARRRDNLTAIIHMTVEAVFWFHPLVWWMGARLEEERERACDEEVSLRCNQPHVYAESVLKVCKFCSESPLACVSGITGADLKKRIMQIMTGGIVSNLGFGGKCLLVMAAAMTVGVPVLFGRVIETRNTSRLLLTSSEASITSAQTNAIAVNPPVSSELMLSQTSPDASLNPVQSSAATSAPSTASPTPIRSIKSEFLKPGALPAFVVATIKPSKPDTVTLIQIRGNRFATAGTTFVDIFKYAYGVNAGQVVGGPEWLRTQKFDVLADPETEDRPSSDEMKAMVQQLLLERFHLVIHQDKKNLSVYALMKAAELPNLTKSVVDPSGTPRVAYDPRGQLRVGNVTMADFATFLQRFVLDRPAVDQTGIVGRFTLSLQWTPDNFTGGEMPVTSKEDASAPPNLFTAIKEQLGLKLQPTKARADVIVIDRVDHPSDN